MPHISRIVGGLILVFVAVSQAQAADGFYVGASGGGYFREETTFTAQAVGNPTIRGSAVESYDPGAIFNVSAGYKWRSRFRAEVEFGYVHESASQIVDGPPFNITQRVVSGGVGTKYVGTVNLFYDLTFVPSIVPYVGGGVGGLHGEVTTTTLVDQFGRVFHQGGGNGSRGVYFVEGGLNLPLAGNFTLVPAYRYMRLFGGQGLNKDEAAHIAKIGLRYAF